MGIIMYQGVYDIGVGVSDMEKALKCYRDDLGFSTVLFDCIGDIPDLPGMVHQRKAKARIVLLENPNKGTVGVARIRLVQLLSPVQPAPLPEGIRWGEVGVAEVSIEVSNIAGLTTELTGQKGYPLAMPVACPPTEPGGRDSLMSYILDQDGGKVEMIDISGSNDIPPKTYGVYHVAVGTANLEHSEAFYRELGLTKPIWSMQGVIKEMTPWHGKDQRMRIVILAGESGGCIELVQQIPDTKDCRGLWGHLGAMDFSIQVTNLEEAMEDMKQRGIEFGGEPVTITGGSGKWRYVYFTEPDSNYVSLVEAVW